MERFGTELGIQVDQTTSDRRFTLKAVRCIGCCGLAPAVMVGGEVHGKLALRDVSKIIERYAGREAA
jgi:NADH:ubiquinone oxidoreductase subunit E